jgi:hypothetical protein
MKVRPGSQDYNAQKPGTAGGYKFSIEQRTVEVDGKEQTVDVKVYRTLDDRDAPPRANPTSGVRTGMGVAFLFPN